MSDFDRESYDDYQDRRSEDNVNDDQESSYYKTMGFNLRDRFVSDMMKMLSDGSFNDVCIKLHDGEIKANKSVLAARSEYFAATFRWKNNNNHDVEEIVVNDCSKKIMTRIIEYIFSGFLKAKDLNLLEFLELKDQAQKMFPGDEVEKMMEHYLIVYDNTREELDYRHKFSFPTNEEIVNAMSLVESGNLQSQVLAELGQFTEKEDNCGLEQISALASLAYHCVLDSVEELYLISNERLCSPSLFGAYNFHPLDLGFVPAEHLQALVTCVTGSVYITNVINYDMTSLLDSLQCKELHLAQRLNQEETETLVRAMTSRVEIVHLGNRDGITSLDVDTLTKYKGDGKCREVHCFWIDLLSSGGDRWIEYESIETWAEEMNWNIDTSTDEWTEYIDCISVTRKNDCISVTRKND